MTDAAPPLLRRALEQARSRAPGPLWRAAVEVRIPHEVLGTEYGGHAVSLHRLDRDSVVYSFGLGEDVSFDLALVERVGCKVHGFDPTPRSLEWLRSQTLPPELRIEPVGVAAQDGVLRFHLPKKAHHVSLSTLPGPERSGELVELPVERLATIMARLGHDRLDVLKLDVEGSEYEVLDDVLASALRPTQLLVEFHHRFRTIPARRTKDALAKLRAAGYRVFRVSPTGMEISLVLCASGA